MGKNLTTGYLLDFYGPLLTGRQREALDMYYNMDYSLGEIAAEFGVTRQGVHRLILQGEKRLLEMEAVLGCAALYGKAAEVLACIEEAEDGSAESRARLTAAAAALARQMERDANGI